MSQQSTFPVNDVFEAAVIADCDNDLPRLVYADWLDENGDPDRASFIRVQCELDAMSPAHDSYDDLKEFEGELTHRISARRWYLSQGPQAFAGLNDVYSRGFLTSVTVQRGRRAAESDGKVKQWAKALGALCKTTTVRRLNTHGLSAVQVAILLKASGAEQLREVEYHNIFSDKNSSEVVSVILASRCAARLNALKLGAEFNGDVAKAMAKVPFTRLRRLVLLDFPCPAKDTTALLACPGLQQLESVWINPHQKNLSAAVHGLSRLPRLHGLALRAKKSADDLVLPTLAAAGGFDSLAELVLCPEDRPLAQKARFEEAGLRQLANRDFPSLRSLNLQWFLDAHHLDVLATAPWFQRLRRFEYIGELGEAGFKQLLACGVSKSLRHFHCGDLIGWNQMKCFTGSGKWPELTSLRLIVPGVSAKEQAVWFAKAKLPKLRTLDLSCGEIDDAALDAFANNPTFANLRSLRIAGEFTGTADGTMKFFTSANARNLIFLDWYGLRFGQHAPRLLDKGVLPQIARATLSSSGIPDELKGQIRLARPEFSLW